MKRYEHNPVMKRNTLYRAALSLGMSESHARKAAEDIMSGEGSAEMAELAKQIHHRAAKRANEARGKAYMRKMGRKRPALHKRL